MQSSIPPASSQISNEYQLGVVKRLCIASCICASFVGVELVSGYLSGSLAIWSDALHLTTDLFAFLIAIGTSYLASKKSTKTFTYGFKRLESVAALFSVGSLVVVTVWLLFASISRFATLLTHAQNDDDGVFVDGSLMSVTAMLGVVVNIALACILRENHVHLPGSACGHDHSVAGAGCSTGFVCAHQMVLPAPPPKVDLTLTEEDDIEMMICRPCSDVTPCVPCVPCVIPNGRSERDEQSKGMNMNGWSLPSIKSSSNNTSNNKYQLVSETNNDDEEENAEKTPFTNINPTRPTPSEKVSTNVNLDAAYLHAITDLAQSVIVLITGCVIWWKPNWYLLDPLLTLCFSLLVLYGSKNIIIRSLSVLLEVKPPNIDYDQILNAISNLTNVSNVCGLRIWCVSDGQIGLTAHINVTVTNTTNNNNTLLLREALGVLKERFSIDSQYVTLQIYQNDADICPSCGYNSINQTGSEEHE